jgi:hypothetical protein
MMVAYLFGTMSGRFISGAVSIIPIYAPKTAPPAANMDIRTAAKNMRKAIMPTLFFTLPALDFCRRLRFIFSFLE